MGVRTLLTELRNLVTGKTFEVWEEANGDIQTYQNGNALVEAEVNHLTGGIEFNGLPIVPSDGALFATIGDSITYQNTNGSDYNSRGYGYATWLSVLSGGRLITSNALTFGAAGDNTAGVLSRVPDAVEKMVAANCRYCVVHAGTNDLAAGISYADTVSNLKAIYYALLNAGITPVIMPIIPRARSTSGVIQPLNDRYAQQRVNAWIRAYTQSMSSVIIADPTISIVDHAASGANLGDPIGGYSAAVTAMTYDGLHPAPRGAYQMGKALWAALQYRVGALATNPVSPIDLYDATYNPSGNLLLSGRGWMAGSGGTPGTGASGTIPATWSARRTVGTTGAIVCSTPSITLPNGQSYKAFAGAMSAVSGSASETFQQFISVTTGFSAGDSVYAEVAISVSAVGAGSLKNVQLLFKGSSGLNPATVITEETGYLPDEAWSGVLRTQPFKVDASDTSLAIYVQTNLDGTVSGNGVTVTIERAAIRKVIA